MNGSKGQAGQQRLSPGNNRLILLLAVCVVFALTYLGPVSMAGSDPELTLLVSQSILEHRTIRLDAYRGGTDLPLDDYKTQQKNGHDYNYFPLGPSVFSLPFVLAANLLGQDMAVAQENHQAQKAIAALLCALVFLLTYGLCRSYLAAIPSLLIATVSVLGSALVSTMGTALWSHNFAVLFVSLSLLLVVRHDSDRSQSLHPFLLGALLFAAFFSRPTAVTFVAAVLIYLFLTQGRAFFATAAAALVLLLLFVAFSWVEYGQPLPDYYLPTRLGANTTPLWEALYGHLLSPSRGLLIFSPFVALVLAGAAWFFSDLWRQPLFWLGMGWFGSLLLVAAVGGAAVWWGGHCFGPRLLTDALPALILLTIILWREVGPRLGPRATRTAAGSYLALGFVAIVINSGQGLLNPYSVYWNATPDIERYPEYLFDWRYPQFLASRRSLHSRNLHHYGRVGQEPEPPDCPPGAESALKQPLGQHFRPVPEGRCRGRIDLVLWGDRDIRAVGWAWDEAAERAPAFVLLVDDAGLVQGCGDVTEQRPDVARSYDHLAMTQSGWRGTALPPSSGDSYQAYAILADRRSACPFDRWP